MDHALVLVDHRVERIADDDDERIRADLLGIGRDVTNDGQVRGHEVVARLTRFSRNPRGDDEDVGPLEIGPAGGPPDVHVVADDRAVLLEVERLALGEALPGGHVEQEDVAELFVREEARELAADVPRTDQSDFVALGHWFSADAHMCSMMLSPNSEHLISVDPSIMRAKS